MTRSRKQLILGILVGVIIFSLPIIPFVLESAVDGEIFPEKLGNVSLVRESQGISLIDQLDVVIPKDHILDVRMGTYVDMYGRSANIMLIKYPDHKWAFNNLELLKTSSNAKSVNVNPLTAPAVFSVVEVNSARYLYVKKSIVYVVDLNGVEFEVLRLAIMNV